MENNSKEPKCGTIESFFSSQTTKKQKNVVSLSLGEQEEPISSYSSTNQQQEQIHLLSADEQQQQPISSDSSTNKHQEQIHSSSSESSLLLSSSSNTPVSNVIDI
ncbi:unnamed protein product, partial [Rotaria magnacalcarata]